MAEIPEIGKISSEIFSEIIFPRLGAHNPQILFGPRHVTDVGKGIVASIAGGFTEKSKGLVLLNNGRIYPLRHPNVDPFWKAFYEGTEKYKTYID
jgi:hypothetical protein